MTSVAARQPLLRNAARLRRRTASGRVPAPARFIARNARYRRAADYRRRR